MAFQVECNDLGYSSNPFVGIRLGASQVVGNWL